MSITDDKNKDLFLDEDEEVIVLKNEETGEEVEFTLVAMLEDEDSGKVYAYLEPNQPVEGFEEGDLLINEVVFDEDGNESYLPIESEEELDRAFKLFDDDYYETFGMHCDGSDGEDDEEDDEEEDDEGDEEEE